MKVEKLEIKVMYISKILLSITKLLITNKNTTDTHQKSRNYVRPSRD